MTSEFNIALPPEPAPEPKRILYLAVDNGHGFEEVVTESTSRLKAIAALVAAASNLNRGVPTEKTK